VSLFRSKAEHKLVEKGLDPKRLPPGQYLTEKWPVLHAGTVPQTDLSTWDFKVFGEVEEPTTLTYDELKALPQTEITVDIHCVTRWSRFDTSFKGVHWRELTTLVRPKSSARFVLAHAEQGFTANVPLAALEDDEALIGSSCRRATSGRARSGSAAWSCCPPTSRASGSATATTTTPISGRSSATGFK